MSTRTDRRSRRRSIAAAFVTVTLAGVATACGGGGGDGVVLSAAGERGKQISNSNGCASCHGVNGQGGVGPSWQGLAGSERPLQDGTTVIADDAYLERAIVDPDAELLEGYALRMPANPNLDESEVDAIVAYINDLAAVTD